MPTCPFHDRPSSAPPPSGGAAAGGSEGDPFYLTPVQLPVQASYPLTPCEDQRPLILAPEAHPEIQLSNQAMTRAAQRWIVGHHVLFFFWGTLDYVSHLAQECLLAQDLDGAARHLNSAAVLAEADIAALFYTGDFTAGEYAHLRVGMERTHSAFAAAMSREGRTMKQRLRDLDRVVKATPELPLTLTRSYEGFQQLRTGWYREHVGVAGALQNDVVQKLESLLDRHLKEQKRTNHTFDRRRYIEEEVVSDAASDAYDGYFMVRRRTMTRLAYLAEAARVKVAILPDLLQSSLDPQQRWSLIRGIDEVIAVAQRGILGPLA